MLPSLSSGKKVLARKKWFFCTIKKDDVIALKDPRDGKVLIKRVKDIKRRNYFVVGDNAGESTDSREFGWIKENDIIGKVILCLSP